MRAHHPMMGQARPAGEARTAVVAAAVQQQPSSLPASSASASAARAPRSRDSAVAAVDTAPTTTPLRPCSRERRREREGGDGDDRGQATTTRRAALASLGLWLPGGGAARAATTAAAQQERQQPQPAPSLCSLLGLPSGTDDDAAASTSARLIYDGPGPFLALQLPRLEHTCAPCFPASCVGDRCLQQIYVTYPRPLARRADIAAAAKRTGSNDSATALDPLGAPYPLAVISGGFLLGSDSYASLAARLATWGYVAVRYDRRDGLTDLLDDVSCAELLTDLVAWCSRDPLLKRLADPSRTLLVGHSRGCKIGALAALRLQEEEARERAEEEALMAARGGRVGAGRRRTGGDDADAAKCTAVDAAEAALDAGNAAAEAEALNSAPPPAPVTTTTPRKRPRVVGMVCLDPVDTTKYAPESPRFPSALALMRQRAAAEAQGREVEEAAAKEERGQKATPAASLSSSTDTPSPVPGIADLPWIILGAAAGTDCAPPGSNYSAWFDQVPGPAVEIVIPGAGHMAFTDPAGGGGGGGGADGSGGGGGSTSLARSVCSVGTADEGEVRRASMALAVAFAEGVVRRGQGGVLAALAEQRCAAPVGGGVVVAAATAAAESEASVDKKRKKTTTTTMPSKPPTAPGVDADAGANAVVLRSTRQAMERTLLHLRANPGGSSSGPATPPPPSAGGLRTRWRGYPSP